MMKTSVCKLCRREGVKLFLKGNRCETSKCAIQKRNFPPGAHPWTRVRHSEYRTQLREKQKLKRFYGVEEKQFTNYYRHAVRMPGNTGENLLALLERRLDNVLFTAGLASSRRSARQMIGHGHILVNDHRCNVSSRRVRIGDRISVTAREKIRSVAKQAFEFRSSYPVPAWLDRDATALEARISNLPARSDITFEVREQLVVELMSK
jgi:small subunit ribosomal protein S4